MNFETSQMRGGALVGDEVVAETGRQQRGSRPPPPFLVKTFELVDDPETNSIISWNFNGTSFVIWDHIKFSVEILPRISRTNNLSSFIYQLNYYGFRKVCWERYEYHNELFQAGKKHLLKDIKRRNHKLQLTKTKRARFTTKDDVMDDEAVKTKLEAMMNEQNEVKLKIQKLGETLENMKEQFMHYVNDSERARLDGSSSTGLTVELQEKEVVKGKAAENSENCGFWRKVMESVQGGGEGVLAPHHYSKAILELEEEMMASDVAMQSGKPCDLNVDDYDLLQLLS